MAYIYQHIRLDKNSIFYIGVGTKDDQYKRAYSNKNRNQYWNNIVKLTDYKVEIVEDKLSFNEAFEKEIIYINKYKRFFEGGILCNIANGGNGGNLGKEVNLKKSIKLQGHKLSEETKNKIRIKSLNKKISSETKKKMSEKHKQIKTGNWLQTKGHLNGRAKPILQFDLNNNFIKEWDCAIYAVNALNLNKSSVCEALKGSQKTSGGFIWKYK